MAGTWRWPCVVRLPRGTDPELRQQPAHPRRRHARGGFRDGVAAAVTAYARERRLLTAADPDLGADRIGEGLTAVVSVKLDHPEFIGATHGLLGDAAVRACVAEAVREHLGTWLEEHPEAGQRPSSAGSSEATRAAGDDPPARERGEAVRSGGVLAGIEGRAPATVPAGRSGAHRAEAGRRRSAEPHRPRPNSCTSAWNTLRGPGADGTRARRNCYTICRPWYCAGLIRPQHPTELSGMLGSRLLDRRPPHYRCPAVPGLTSSARAILMALGPSVLPSLITRLPIGVPRTGRCWVLRTALAGTATASTAVLLLAAPDHRGPPGPVVSPVAVLRQPWLRNSTTAPSCALQPRTAARQFVSARPCCLSGLREKP